MNKQEVSKMIDHTILKPNASKEDVKKICEESIEHNFCSVCVNPVWVKYVSSLLKGSDVKVCSVIGFPLGASTSEIKRDEAKKAVDDGADEIDMVINIGYLKSKEIELFKKDIELVREATKGKILKVIIETCLLTDEEKIEACKISKELKADFVKTSTGFSTGGAKVEDVKLMRSTVGSDMGVKASGGIKNYEDALKMIEAGANRIGTSSGIDIIKNFK